MAITPSVPLPTDNFYKFICLLGLTMFLAGMVATYSIYNDALSTKTRLLAEIGEPHPPSMSVSAPVVPSALKQRLLEVTQKNEQMYVWVIGIAMGLGVVFIATGSVSWYKVVQLREDKIADLQLRKLQLEVLAMESAANVPPEAQSTQGDG